MEMVKIGLQIYTLWRETEKDFVGTVNEVGKMEYDGLELAGMPNCSEQELKELLDKNNLQVAGAHLSFEEQEADMEGLCGFLSRLGAKKITIPAMRQEMLAAEALPETARRLNELNKRAEACGLEFSYHNHWVEMVDNRMETLLELCPHMQWELDTYWAKYAGRDPLQTMKELGDRLTLLHIKDMAPGELTPDTPNPAILEGIIDIQGLLEQANRQGIDWALVEMDNPDGDPLTLTRRSVENLRKAGF